MERIPLLATSLFPYETSVSKGCTESLQRASWLTDAFPVYFLLTYSDYRIYALCALPPFIGNLHAPSQHDGT